ncbi:NAD+ synthase (glutamine-hydrolysing) [Synechococcus sp. BIOS-E4-1]|uniref:NAD+ synthase n=1 Tax=Synechococcus sp. BIOS-E4-1 TaxID=1400864 RepID=UPI001648B292|nr:NAD+ synthase [Synechococcus sp. BIOS-E4-1]QNI56022.1 NAD+ synthase (glutamine-hydrolysing) [Synechococcus sp. BIOS-E4-1]
MRVALAQINPVVGDLLGNATRILKSLDSLIETTGSQPDLLVTPELSLWGYPPRDLLFSPTHLQRQREALDALRSGLADRQSDIALLVGIADPADDALHPALFNAITLVQVGGDHVVARKQLLPSYDVFDETRYFRPSHGAGQITLSSGDRNWRLGITICEDLWVDQELHGRRLVGPDPVADLIPSRIDALINCSASPFGRRKAALRRQLAARAAQRLGCPVVYVNQVGGNDELVFDGASFVMGNNDETPLLQLPDCREAIQIWNAADRAPSTITESATTQRTQTEQQEMEALFRTLVTGVKDYAGKCGFQRVLLGLSGGIDSALVAVIAAAALGSDQVQTLLMPSPWSSDGSLRDALKLADRLGIAHTIVPIENLMDGFQATLTPALESLPSGVTAENLQSRIRGTLLMAMANQQGQLLLTTGNKSELAVGYCTLYGDMNGGLAVIGDLYKSTVFALCHWIDSSEASLCRKELALPAEGELIGSAILEKPPSAELRPDQKDSDSLPDYDRLDPLLIDMIEHRLSGQELTAAGHDPEEVQRIENLFRRAEFKRRQAAPLLKVSAQAFGSGWRLPIAAV